MRRLLLLVVLFGLCALFYATSAIFVVPPVPAVIEGKTLIVTRMKGMAFLDSPAGWCAREAGEATVICQGLMLTRVAQDARILLELPYSETLADLAGG